MASKSMIDLEYEQALLQDQIKDLHRERATIRKEIRDAIINKFPEHIEQLYPVQDQRLIRLYKLHPKSLSPLEIEKVHNLIREIEHLANGCFNLSIEQERELQNTDPSRIFELFEFPRKLCFDIANVYNRGWINFPLGLVDVPLDGYQYPLNPEDSARFIRQLSLFNLDLKDYKTALAPEILKTMEKVTRLISQANF